MLEALASRTLTSNPLLEVSPKEPERAQQEYSGQHRRENEKEATDGNCRRRRRCRLLWRRCSNICSWVEDSDDKVWSSAHCYVDHDSSSRYVEHQHRNVGEGTEAELLE